MLKGDIISTSKSPWNSSFFIVPKKAGSDGANRWRD